MSNFDTHAIYELKRPAVGIELDGNIAVLCAANMHVASDKEEIQRTLDRVIIGDGSEYERLVFAAYQLGIKDHVTFAGILPQVDVKKQLEHSDMYLQYSIQEGFCNAVLEAQAMGLLCIVSNAEGLAENVLDGKTGWVLPKRQPELLAEKIKDVIGMSHTE